jgi:hypothetical protein
LQKSVAIDRERGDLGELSYALARLEWADRGLGIWKLCQEYVKEALQTAVVFVPVPLWSRSVNQE